MHGLEIFKRKNNEDKKEIYFFLISIENHKQIAKLRSDDLFPYKKFQANVYDTLWISIKFEYLQLLIKARPILIDFALIYLYKTIFANMKIIKANTGLYYTLMSIQK